MNIGIDLRHIQPGVSGGIMQYLKGLLAELFKTNKNNQYTLFCTIFNWEAFEHTKHNHTNIITLPCDNFYEQMNQQISKLKIKILIRSFPSEGNDDLSFPLSKQIFLIPDLQHEIFPEFFSPETLETRRITFNDALSNAGAILTLSTAAKKSLLAHSWTKCKDIFVANPALQPEHKQHHEKNLSEIDNDLIPKKSFFLFPANLWPHKNHRRILNAFRLFLNATRADIEFIFTGHPNNWEALVKDFTDLPIKHLGFVSTALLTELMKRANALVFFSLYEGFGIPLLEAFHASTPVICSNTTSLPEIGGNAILSCDPTDIYQMSKLMQMVYQDESTRKQLIQSGKKQLELFTWQQSAKNVLDAYKVIIKKNRRKRFKKLLSFMFRY